MQSYNLLEKNTQKDGKANTGPDSVCSYWEPETRSCLLVRDGIFLPVGTQISTYCLTSQYTICHQFEQLAIRDSRDKQADADNRRRSIRIPCHHVFRFSEMTGSDQLPSIREDDAWTVDLSAHGVCFATRQMIPLETVLQFEVCRGSGKESILGTGQVIWSKPIENSPLFHSAIAFTRQPSPLHS
ncbi:MAG: PilZ domain-containing protein [Desulfobulbus sp.]|nr:PilZ domain-containing protein [Desulfobulbus sp.]